MWKTKLKNLNTLLDFKPYKIKIKYRSSFLQELMIAENGLSNLSLES